MVTDAFLAYKETLTDYLQNFVQALQRRAYKIEGNLRQISQPVLDLFMETAADDELRRPRLEDGPTREELLEEYRQGWGNLQRWFMGDGRAPSELTLLERATKDAIARIVRCVLRIQERKRSGLSRRKELDYLGHWFYRTESIDEAHRLAAYAFGLFPARHLQGEDLRESDRADLSMWQEGPTPRFLRSRSRKRADRQETEPVQEHGARRRQARERIMEHQREELQLLMDMVARGEVRMSELGVVTSGTRLRLLQWIGRCNASAFSRFRTPEGIDVSLTKPGPGETTVLRCEDGELELPDYRLAFAMEGSALWEAAAGRQE